MSIFNRGSKAELEELKREEARKEEREQEATAAIRRGLDAADAGLRVKREVREKAARFIGAFRPYPGK